jgi:Ca2+-binding RTX toxin-like protein
MYLTACGVSDPPKDNGDTTGIPELNQALNPPTLTPAFVVATGVLTITFAAAGGETLIVSTHPVSGAVLVNDVAVTGATTKTVKQVVINGATGKDDTLILDFANGFFSPGLASAAGWVIDFKGAAVASTDLFKLRGTSLGDTVTLGGTAFAAKIAFNTDANLDMTVAGSVGLGYTFSLGAGNDIFNAFAGTYGTSTKFLTDVTVYGGIGDDQLTGGDGNDTFYGDVGNDTMNGGTKTSDLDVYWGGAGADVVTYAGRAGAVNVTIAPNVTIAVTPSADDGDIVGLEGDDIRNDVETVIGGLGDDTFLGNAGAQTFFGGAGNDTFLMGDATTGAGADTVWGEAGIDTVDYSARLVAITVSMDLGKADDGAALETDNIEADVENLICPLIATVCTVTGNALDNTITGGTGADILTGGAGDDTFLVVATASGAATYTGGAGVDLIDFSAYGAIINVKMDGTVSTLPLNKKIDVENLKCDATAACTVNANAFNNRIWGSSSADTINGLGGDDFIETNGGADIIDCGDGSDILLDSGGAAVNPLACEL